MPFSVTQMIADSQQNVVAVNWAYSNEDGTLSNQHVMSKPYGTTPFKDVTEGVATGWLEEQLQKVLVAVMLSLHPAILVEPPHNLLLPMVLKLTH